MEDVAFFVSSWQPKKMAANRDHHTFILESSSCTNYVGLSLIAEDYLVLISQDVVKGK